MASIEFVRFQIHTIQRMRCAIIDNNWGVVFSYLFLSILSIIHLIVPLRKFILHKVSLYAIDHDHGGTSPEIAQENNYAT